MIKEKLTAWTRYSQLIGALFAKLPFTPDFYTWLTVPVALASMLCIVYGAVWTGVGGFIAAGALDLVDGAVARHTNQTSNSGAFLDGSLDRFIDCALIFSYFWLPLHTPLLPAAQWIYLAMFFAIMPSFEVAYANHRGAVADPEEKYIWRILNRGEMYVLMLLVPVTSQYSSLIAGYVVTGLVALAALTTVQTIVTTLRLAAKSPK